MPLETPKATGTPDPYVASSDPSFISRAGQRRLPVALEKQVPMTNHL
jgi:hypothetical protein